MKAFFDAIRRKPFGGHLTPGQVQGINTILDAWAKWGDGDKRKLAYVLATAYHETARTMQPIEEMGGRDYLRRKPYWPYYGRGFVQLTWRANYADWGKRLGVSLVDEPHLAMRPDYAGRILVQGMMLGTFTGKGLPDYIGGRGADYVQARRIVNGLDRAELIADYARQFEAALELVETPIAEPQAASVEPNVPSSGPNASSGSMPPVPVATGSPAAVAVAGGVATVIALGAAFLKYLGWI